MKALVTGGCGFIGGALVSRLVEDEHEVVVLDNLHDGYLRMSPDIMMRPSALRVIPAKVQDAVCLRELDGEKFDALFHFAAHYANLRSVEEPMENVDTNCTGTMAMLEFARRNNIRYFVYASSSISATETGKPEVMTPYGITKYCGELLCECYAERHGLSVVAPRFFNVYGPGDRPGKYRAVIPNFYRQAIRGEKITITGDKQARDWTYVGDVVNAVLDGLDLVQSDIWDQGAPRFLCYNIAKGYSDKVKDVARIILDLTESKSELEILPDRDWEGIQDRVGDVTAFKKYLPYAYDKMTSLRTGLGWSNEWYAQVCQ